MTWEGLTPPYRTIVADPPWHYDGWPKWNDRAGVAHDRTPLPYSSMPVPEIAAMPVAALADSEAHLYLWTTNRYLRDAHEVAEAWGFAPSQVLVWCKPPMGVGPGGAWAQTHEYVVFARRGSLAVKERIESSWFHAGRGAHSEKPGLFLDLVERVSPGPYVELFCRQPRFGWDSWGHGYENFAEVAP